MGPLSSRWVHRALTVKGHHYEDLRGKESDFKQLEQAIIARQTIGFDYRSAETTKRYEVEPYRLINNKGVWYLAARHEAKVKTFSFSKLEAIVRCGDAFVHDAELDAALEFEDGVWFGEQTFEVVLKIDKTVASYFTRRKLIADQVIEKQLADGGLILSAKVGHRNQVIPIVRYWIPHIHIISPDGLQEEIDTALRDYLSISRS
jgi:predicted DNA-binding transcriptional regulator YafY